MMNTYNSQFTRWTRSHEKFSVETQQVSYHNPDGLTETQMQDIARELNNSREAVIAFCASLTLTCPAALF